MKRFVLFIMIVGILFGQKVELGLKINDEQFYIGDRIRLNISVSGGERQMFVLPNPLEWIKDIQILDIQTNEKVKNHRKILDIQIEAVAFDTGFVHIPPMPVIATDSTGFGKPDTIFTPEKYIYINSILDDSLTPVAMTPPLPLALMTWWELLIAIFLLFGSVILLIVGIKYKSRKSTIIEEIWESPQEKAGHFLNELEKKHYPEKKQWKKFYLELTYISRDYFENIYYIHLQELTTTELIPVLAVQINTEYMNELKEFFHYADLVKFAKGIASEKQCDAHLMLVKQIIKAGEKEMEDKAEAKQEKSKH
ncbi:MAG: hypothetical protein U9O95_04460 [Candidatus Marinimicrobia bacterium]|nr:hypothetical protein [Candidatus Neomarinimicrobiota bacterium]